MQNTDKSLGLLWGLLIGDCLGSPIQFPSKDGHPWVTEMVPCDIFGTPSGYWTDDSSMAFCIAESFARLGRPEIIHEIDAIPKRRLAAISRREKIDALFVKFMTRCEEVQRKPSTAASTTTNHPAMD